MKDKQISIFPLGIVVFPGSIQSLQIFEPRYLKMVKRCMVEDEGFVITLLQNNLDNDEIGFAKKGSYVEIVDFNNLPNGLLGITVKCIHKAEIKNICKLDDGLNIGEISPIIEPEVDDQAVLAEHPELLNILSQLMRHPEIEKLSLDINFDSANSVSNHLSGLVPFTGEQKQKLLEAFDASQRLSILDNLITKLTSSKQV